MTKREHKGGTPSEPSASTSTHGPAPGKRTLTDKIQLRRASPRSEPALGSAETLGSGEAVVQRRALDTDLDAALGFFPESQVQRAGGGDAAGDGASVHDEAARGVLGAPIALPHADAIQRSFGRHDISHVQAHTDGQAARAATAIGAEAYATGDHVAFASPPSLHTAAHEAAHVVQQLGGVSLAGGVGREGDVHEQHADQVADAVVAGRSAEPLLDAYAGGLGASTTTGVQRMTVRSGARASSVSSVTHDKHVVADGQQEAEAEAGYGARTFETSDAHLTAAVDADAHDFQEANGAKSARHDFNASVVISQYDKTEAPPAGFAKGKPVTKTIDATATNCEIGVVKGGDDAVKVTHFKKA